MSPCEVYQELISRMIDGELSPREEAALKEHIETCEECAALYSAFSALSRRLGGDLEEVPAELRENVMADIRREELRKKNRIPTILRSVLSVAACAAVVVGVYLGVSFTKDAQLSAAVYDTASAGAEGKATVTEEESVELEVAAVGATKAEAPMEMPVTEEVAEEPEWEPDAMPAEPFMADGDAANGADYGSAEQADVAAEAEAAEISAWDLSHWDLSLLRELLGGVTAELTREELEPAFIGNVLARSGDELVEVPVYALAEGLYYYDPVENAVYQAELSPDEWESFLR